MSLLEMQELDDAIDRLREENARLRALVEKKNTALKIYAWHEDDCSVASILTEDTCSCGLSEALTDAQQPAGTPPDADQLSLDGEGGITRRREKQAEQTQAQSFDAWFSDYNPANKSTAAQMQEAFEAGRVSTQAQAEPDAHELWAAAQLVPGEGIEDGVERIRELLATSPTCAAVPDADALSNFIRQVDGSNKMGAGALAEKIVGWLSRNPPTGGAGHV